MTQENRISKKNPSESPLAVVYQKPEASSPTNDSKMLRLRMNEWDVREQGEMWVPMHDAKSIKNQEKLEKQ